MKASLKKVLELQKAYEEGLGIGYKAGIMRVVEFIKEGGTTTYHVWDKCLQADERNDEVYAIFPEDLRVKLKEWGVE